MTMRKFEDAISELDDLLEAERDALLSGNLDQIGRLLERKEALIDELSTLERFESDTLQSLTGKLKRNQALLDSALEGIRKVAKRLAALRRVRSTLDTYDSNGAKKSIDIVSEGSIEKRA